MDNICAVLFTLVLFLPLVLQLQLLIANPKKLCTIFHYYASNSPGEFQKTSSPILQYYPKEPIAFNAANSDSTLLLTNLRTVSSSPVIQNGLSILRNSDGEIKKANPIETVLTDARHSRTFVKTDQVVPVVDITCNYNSYRYKTFESCLRSYYGDKYPPGEVLLNSMQLNLLDSHTNVPRVTAGIFDFAKVEDEPGLEAVPRKLEIEYLNPLDHFVVRQPDCPSTEDRFTETDEQDRCHNATSWQKKDPIGTVITAGQEKHQANQRSSRKIRAPGKYYLSSSGRVNGTNHSSIGRKASAT